MTSVSGTTAATSTELAATAPSSKSRFLRAYERNHAKTRQVLHAFPRDKSEFRPHERSNSALRLAWTFVVEERVMAKALKSEPILGTGWPTAPDSWEAGGKVPSIYGPSADEPWN